MNDVLARMAAHRTVRRFHPTPVPDEHVRAAVASARMASTSSWIQAYHLLQVTRPEVRAELAELCGGQAQVAQAGAFFVVSADTRRHRLVAGDGGRPYDPNLETFVQVVIDAALFAQNLALAFESLGHGICMIGGLRNRLPEADAFLALPHGVWPLFGMCVGEPAEDPGQRPRLPVEALWSKDRYPTDDQVRAWIAEHDREAGEHYAARGLEGRTWSGGIWRKFARRTREHLAGFLRGKGAVLE